MTATLPAYSKKDFQTDQEVRWCPGCGDYAILSAVQQVFPELGVPREKFVVVSGIGCSSRLPGYVETYGFNTVHGRALPIATGMKLANPALEVVVVGGDGDAFAIGAGHLPHAMRRNVDMAYVVMDNGIYGLTKGQASPTSPLGLEGKSSPAGTIEEPLEPLKLALALGCSWVGQGFAGDPKGLEELMTRAIRHRGFAFLNVFSPCVVFRGKEQYDELREHVTPLPADWSATDRVAAFRLLEEKRVPLPIGVLFREERPTFGDRLAEQRRVLQESGVRRVEELVEGFLP